MKRILWSALLVMFLFSAAACFAAQEIPNLVGTWTAKAEGGVMVKGEKPGAKTHYTEPFGTLSAEITIEKQQGRVLHGTFKSPRATEKFIAIIGRDNKKMYYADEDGFLDGTIIDKNTLEVVYRHVTAKDAVVAVGVWTRKK
ncbi:MAG: hypothetical protein RDV48_18920 [Candidatus Eremiobacteraeota bacterium]|nr:hypothetical protein [Candidatus Eremiobacteraeota bacterium]